MTSEQILVVSGSIRRASVHSAIARAVADELARRSRAHLLLDLTEFDMPLYHGDHEADRGVPDEARRLADLLQSSGGLLLATPEYNGAVTPLVKNTVDWVTRVDIGVLRDTFIGLIAASPGRGGGARGLAMVRTWFGAMRLTLADTDLALPSVRDSILVDDRTDLPRVGPPASTAITEFVDLYLQQFEEYCHGRPPG